MADRVLGVLAGADMARQALRAWADSAEVVLAADAGADRLAEAGAKPDRIVGDLDSISDTGRFPGVEVIEDADESRTDCDKLLRLAESMGFGSITLACVEGDSLDHVLASIASALQSPLDVRLALRTGIGWLVRPGRAYRVATQVGSRVSLIPLTDCSGVSLEGVRWPLAGASLSLSGLLSISNRAENVLVSASVGEGSALLVVEYRCEELPVW